MNLSLIIPVYNGEKYIQGCVAAAHHQTYKDFEIILVDDGSKDGSPQICDELAAQHHNVRVIHKENGGINHSRMMGVKAARGEWVAFCDQDDSYIPTAFEEMMQLADDTDMVVGCVNTSYPTSTPTLEQARISSVCGEIPPSPWGRMFRKEYLTDDVFDIDRKLVIGEDYFMNLRVLFKMQRAPRLLRKSIYNYRRNTASFSHEVKNSIAYEEYFYGKLDELIPAEERLNYLHAIIRLKLNGLVSVASRNPQEMRRSNYLAALKRDIHDSKYKMNFNEWLLLHLRSSAGLKCYAFCNFAYRSLKYRLGL